MKKSWKPINQGIAQLAHLLKSGDIEAAQTLAASIYQQRTAVPAPAAPPFSGLTVDPALVARTNRFLRHKAAAKIAECHYDHAEVETAKQWAAACDFNVNDMYTRRARVLLGHIATAMDKDDEAIAHYTAVINLKNRFREQPAAYAGLLELLQVSHQDDQIEPWVRHGLHKFRNGGGIERRFLQTISRVLRRRNHPLWREINEQVVAKTADGKKWKLKAQRELASNARKFGKHDEAETHYAAICSQPMKSTRDTVNMYLFLAESMAKQGKDYSATLQELQTKATEFRTQEQKDYARYRIAKFYESQGQPDQAAARYQQLVTYSASQWSAAALTMLGKLAEKQGDTQRALQLYLEYPQRFPQSPRLVLQSYASALNAAEKLGDTEATDQILGEIAARAAAINDYNVHLNLAFNYRKKGQRDLAKQFLESGVALAAQELARTSEPAKRYKIHFHVLRRLNDFSQDQQILDYFTEHSNELASLPNDADESHILCFYFKAVALHMAGEEEEAKRLFESLLSQVENDPKLEAIVGGMFGLLEIDSPRREAALALFERLTEKHPMHPWANSGKLEIAISKFNQRHVSEALKLAEEIIATSSGHVKMTWIRNEYWSAVYLRGRCLKARGKAYEGESLMREAMVNALSLEIAQQLRE